MRRRKFQFIVTVFGLNISTLLSATSAADLFNISSTTITVPRPAGCECLDYYGSCRKESDAWIEDATWRYACEKETAEFKGCVASDRGGRQHVATGANVTIGGLWYFCNADENKLRYMEEPICNMSGKVLRVGQTFKDRAFKMVCQEWGTEAIGCWLEDKEIGDIEMTIGQQLVVGCYNHTCTRASEIPWKVRYSAKPTKGCVQPAAADKRQTELSAISHGGGDSIALIDDTKVPLPLHIFSEAFFKGSGTDNHKLRYLN